MREGEERHFPGGYASHRKMFTRGGYYFEWLMKHDFVKKVGKSIFVHAGMDLGKEWTLQPIEEINRKAKEELETFLEARDELAKIHLDHPFLSFAQLLELSRMKEGNVEKQFEKVQNLFRGILARVIFSRALATSDDSDSYNKRLMEQLLSYHRAQRVVVGHTVVLDGISLKYLSKKSKTHGLVMIDTGMSSYYGGPPQALEIFEETTPKGVLSDIRIIELNQEGLFRVSGVFRPTINLNLSF